MYGKTEEGKAEEREGGRKEVRKGRKGTGGKREGGRKEGRKEGRKWEGGRGVLELNGGKHLTSNTLHTNPHILPNKHLTKTANTIPRHQTRAHIRTTLFIHLFVYSFTI